MVTSIFKAYDIRGLYPSELNAETAYLIGRALAEYTKASTIVVGHDMRESSPEIEEALIKGIIKQGVDAVKIGLVSTPMLYHASGILAVDAGVIVTASHNPSEYNGFKLCLKNAIPIGEGSGMAEIKNLAVTNNFSAPIKMGGINENKEFQEKYFSFVAKFFKTGFPKKKIVIDFANGMGIPDKEIYRRFANDIETVYMFDELDGNFPNHEANPLKTETLADLQKKVLEEKADLGIAYDGDADRVGLVDEKGDVVPMDFVGALLAKEVLKNNPGGLVLMDLRSSNATKEVIEEAGGRVHRCRVGHSPIKKQMREEKAIFAGELSGHYYFQENFNAEMSTLAAIKILNLLNETGETFSKLTQDLKRYYHSGEINSKVSNKEVVFAKLKNKYSDGILDELDGVRIDYPDWWFNVRASNTEPAIRLNMEAKTKEMMDQKRDEILRIIRD
jgi:phosphomannomutase